MAKKPKAHSETAVWNQRIPTGAEGLDDILAGGLPRNRLYLVQGDPGVGKTTLGLQFLLEGVRNGEPVLFITLSETEAELRAVASSHGWSLEGVEIVELNTAQTHIKGDHYTLFHPSEIELGETTKEILEFVDRIKPARVVFDSMSELRLLARDPLRYRRQILALKQYFLGKNCTVLILDDRTSNAEDLQLQTIAHGVILLEQRANDFGGERRRLRVVKMRQIKYRGGYHDFTIETRGLVIYPRLVAAEHRNEPPKGVARSGVDELDKLLGGGLDRGTSTLFMGAAGSGKSAVAMQLIKAAAARGERSVVYTFDEGISTILRRASALGMDLKSSIKNGVVSLVQIDPAELSPGEFVHRVRNAVAEQHARLIIIDSLNGYLNAMPGEKFLAIQMHELLNFLGQQGVVTILIVSQYGLIGNCMESPVDVSYLADTVLMMRYYENAGEVHKAICVLKKRSGYHERSIHALHISKKGLSVGPPLKRFRGILTGVPVVDERNHGEPRRD